MFRLVIVGVTILALGMLLAPRLSAQPQDSRIVLVDSQAAINAHPAGMEANRLQEQARQEIQELRTEIDALAQKARSGQQLSPEEAERYTALATTLEAVQRRWQEDIQAAATPAVEAVDQAIASLAEANGYTAVLDLVYAQQGLVVYAHPESIITEQLLNEMERQAQAQE